MAELADALDLGSSGETLESSILSSRTTVILRKQKAEICGAGVAEFLGILGECKGSVIQYDEDSLDRELT